MGEIVSLDEAHRKRRAASRKRAEQAAMHPALRWLIRGDGKRAHRRRPGGGTACGLSGFLLLADAETEFCAICYPYWASVQA